MNKFLKEYLRGILEFQVGKKRVGKIGWVGIVLITFTSLCWSIVGYGKIINLLKLEDMFYWRILITFPFYVLFLRGFSELWIRLKENMKTERRSKNESGNFTLDCGLCNLV